jgi:hypothetical protein
LEEEEKNLGVTQKMGYDNNQFEWEAIQSFNKYKNN